MKSLPIPVQTKANVIGVEKAIEKRDDLVHEATSLLKHLADHGHATSQYFLADRIKPRTKWQGLK